MTEAPERIWKADNTHPDGTREYIRADLTPSPEVVKELVEALRENARILGYLSNELQGIVEAGKLAALFNCADRARAALAKLEGGE